MAATVTTNEEGQLLQTIEMFEVITQSQPQDYQSLEILKEAYAKLGRESDVVRTAKRIAEVYVSLGQLSSAILEYESILQRHHDDAEVLAALGEIESRAGSLGSQSSSSDTTEFAKAKPPLLKPKPSDIPEVRTPTGEVDDGRAEMSKLFVNSKLITAAQFDQCWPVPDFSTVPTQPVEPFISKLADLNLVPLEKSLRLLTDRSRTGYLPLDRYEIDLEVTRIFPSVMCLRWCVLPFDQMSKSILVATCNPFNRQAAAEVMEVTKQRVLWYVAPPQDLLKALRRIRR